MSASTSQVSTVECHLVVLPRMGTRGGENAAGGDDVTPDKPDNRR